jgi:hypothetical protein
VHCNCTDINHERRQIQLSKYTYSIGTTEQIWKKIITGTLNFLTYIYGKILQKE